MKKQILVPVFLIALFLSACAMNINELDLTVKNTAGFDQKDKEVVLDCNKLKEMKSDFSTSNFIVLDAGKEIPYQMLVNDKGEEQILFVADFAAGETKNIQIKYGSGIKKSEYTPRTHAELSKKPSDEPVNGKFHGDHFVNVFKYKVPKVHTDHDALFKFEGPGWESEKVGYRFYLDWRNSTDIFGKKEPGLILSTVGVHDTVAKDDSYHEMQDWGMDIFKVGPTLGIGTIAMMADGKVEKVSKTDSVVFEMLQNGPVRSEFKTSYYGWEAGKKKYNLESFISIDAGSRLTKDVLVIDNDAENLATGLAKHENTNFIEKENTGSWSYIALYGKQTLNDDNLGIALFFPQDQLIEVTEDDNSHVVVLKPVNGEVTYYYCAAWEKEKNGIKTQEEFVNYLDQTVNELNAPVKVNY